MTTGRTEPETKRRLVLFVRHNNDVDHLTPVVDMWSRDLSNDAVIVGYSSTIDIRDFRLTYLASKPNVRVARQEIIVNEVAASLGRVGEYTCTVRELLAHLAPAGSRVVMAFDYVVNNLSALYLKAAKDLGIKSITLPHGDDPYVNFMITKDDIDFSGLRLGQAEPPFDMFVSPSRIIARRAEESWAHKHRILGSPRFCDEWLEVLPRLLPRTYKLPQRKSLKLVFFLRNAKYAVFWDEFTRLLRMILNFPNIDLIVASHPREYFLSGENGNAARKNVLPGAAELGPINRSSSLRYISADEIHSAELMEWSDAVLSLGTSVVYEAVCRRKPVFEIEYLHPNRTVVAECFHNSDIRSRDDIYSALQKLVRDPDFREHFYDDSEMARFRDLSIDLGEPGVLDRYVALLRDLADQRS